MSAGKHADVPADSSMKARLEIQNSVPHIGYTMNANPFSAVMKKKLCNIS
jgi:hypothetical protein